MYCQFCRYACGPGLSCRCLMPSLTSIPSAAGVPIVFGASRTPVAASAAGVPIVFGASRTPVAPSSCASIPPSASAFVAATASISSVQADVSDQPCITVNCSNSFSSSNFFCSLCANQRYDLETDDELIKLPFPMNPLQQNPWPMMVFPQDKQTLRCTLGDLSPEFQAIISLRSELQARGKFHYAGKTYLFIYSQMQMAQKRTSAQTPAFLKEFFFLRLSR